MDSVQLVENSSRCYSENPSQAAGPHSSETFCQGCHRQTSVNFAYCWGRCSHLPARWYLLESYLAAASFGSVPKILPTK